ncbi:mucin-12 isoform X3 [Drosophila kikkawai]|uniref:Mucin-12 isoform X3 n=1 Tax=Drosophila kikkawai TaxID=30033 RepID=A0A6P4I6K0_DROKI|nr:uncharacterized protein LOC108071858 isoform X3 [Drosophila kikkawai]
MKPEKLNRLIRGNGRMQPWFLRNTSELYESAVRSYYERGCSGMSHDNRHNRLLRLEDNASPGSKAKKTKKMEPVPSYADEYSRIHRLQVNQAASIASGQRLPTVMKTSRQRSLSFSVGGADMARSTSGARPYSVYEQSELGDSSSTSCSSASSEPSQHRLVMETLPRCLRRSRAIAKRERKRMGRRGSRVIEVANGHRLDTDMGLFSARSLSVPPPKGLGMGNSISKLMGRQMPPCRKQHMKAIEKTTLANAALIPMGESDTLMTVDETLKRQISMVNHTVKGQGTSSELGHHLMTSGSGNGRASGNLLDVIRQPPTVRFRFHTLGDRANQFEYIQFADGPVSNYAFDRRPQGGGYQRRLHKGSSTSSSSSLNTIGGRQEENQHMLMQPLSTRNVLYANHMQRSRSLEVPRGGLLESPLPPPDVPDAEQVYDLTSRRTRGSSLDTSSQTSLSAGQSSASAVAQRHFRHAKPSTTFNSGRRAAAKWTDSREETPRSKPSRTDSSRLRVTCQPLSAVRCAEASPLNRNHVTNSRPTNPEFRGLAAVTQKISSNSGAYSDIKGARNTDWRGSSTTKSQSQRSSVVASFNGASADPSEAASEAFAEECRLYPAHNKSVRVECAPRRRAQLQQRLLEVDSPDEDMPLCLDMVKSKAKPQMMTMLDSPKARLRVAKGTNGTTNRLSRGSHRAYFPAAEDDLTSGHPINKIPHKQPEKSGSLEKESEQREQNLGPQKWVHSTRAITVPSSLPQKTSAQLKGSNPLLAASASQVLAYKRAFRTQQQMLKVEALHQQAQCLQKLSPKPKPSRKFDSNSHFNQQLPEEDLQPVQLPRLQSRQDPTVRNVLKGTAEGKPLMSGLGKGGNVTTGSPVKAMTVPVAASLTAGGTPSLRQKTKAAPGALIATKAVAAATSRPKADGGDPRGGGAAVERRGASTLLQRRDESEQAQSQTSAGKHQRQQQPPRRQFHYQTPPWRSSY